MSNKQRAPDARALSNGMITASIGAVVTAVPEGKKPFAVAYPLPESAMKGLTKDTSITFSLCNWSEGEKNPPEFGQVVTLEKIARFARGWRASSARPVALTDSSKQ
jgi:hypothetical protein